MIWTTTLVFVLAFSIVCLPYALVLSVEPIPKWEFRQRWLTGSIRIAVAVAIAVDIMIWTSAT